jgi:hypothetical protein
MTRERSDSVDLWSVFIGLKPARINLHFRNIRGHRDGFVQVYPDARAPIQAVDQMG